MQEKSNADLQSTFLSGTTISNSLTELYNLFIYLTPQVLRTQKIFSFDSWASIYTIKSREFEFSVTNEIIQKERFRYFVKVPELAAMYMSITDYKSAEDIGVDRPKKNEILISLEQTQQQQEMFQQIKEFATTGYGPTIYREPLTDSEDHARMLLVTNTAKKASLDMRLIGDWFTGEEGNKLNEVANNIKKYYDQFDKWKGTQFVFSDVGVYKKDVFNVYQELKERLIDRGIPESEVEFIQQHNTTKKKRALFEQVNNGSVRILLGSTEMLGTGVNAQERCVAIHHLEIPWTPAAMEQRNGRGARAGNWVAKLHSGNKVDIFMYCTKQTLDAYKFNVLKNKATFISQIKKGSLSVRTIDEGGMDEDSGMSYSECIAVLSGNQDLLNKAKLERKIAQLKSEQITYLKRGTEARKNIDIVDGKIVKNKSYLSRFNIDLQKANKILMDEDGKVKEYRVRLLDKDYYNSNDAGIALNKIFDTEYQDSMNYTKIGDFFDFDIFIRPEVKTYYASDSIFNEQKVIYENKLYVGGEFKYSHNNGNLPRTPELAGEYMIKALTKISGLIDKYDNETNQLKEERKALEEVMNNNSRDFPKKAEIISLEQECKAIVERIEKGLSFEKNTGKNIEI